MSLIFKESIKDNYNKCAKFLDDFDDAQIESTYQYIDAINSKSNTYEMMPSHSRVAILHYLIKLMDNENGCEEMFVWNRFHDIFTFMSALALLKVHYKMNGFLKENIYLK